MQLELALELLGVLRPFVAVQEVFRRATAAVEQRDVTPVVDGVSAVLLDRAAGKGNTFLNEATERSDTLYNREG